MAPIYSVIIVGAGPAGLLLGRLLAKAGIPNIKILERSPVPTEEARAVFYQPIAFHEFKRAGIMEAVDAVGFHPRKAVWRDMSGKALFEMPATNMIALTSDKLAAIVQSDLELNTTAEIKWGHEVTALGEDEASAWVDVTTAEGQHRLEADYVVGCDGGSSTVRRHLFGEKGMPGFTWDKQLVAADIKYDFPAMPDIADSNLFLDAKRFWVLFRPGKEDGFWRIGYADDSSASDEEVLQRYPETLKDLLPGHPDVGDYEIRRVTPYKIHQRIVDKMRKGRFVLASDAAHLCCPYGALGLNGGIADVGSLSDCLQAIHEGKADDSILDVYSDVRIHKWKTIIDPQSQGTLKSLFSNPEDIVPNHPMYKMSQLLAKDPEAAKKKAPNPLALTYDFTPHFKAP